MSETIDSELDPSFFTATVTSLTHSFGDETRRKVYLFLRENAGTTANELAEHCNVHPNVIRHHLDRLTEGGYVTFENIRRAGVGRPSKGYRVTDLNFNPEGSMRRDALLVALLEKSLEKLGPDQAESMAHEVGEAYGRTLADSVGSNEKDRSVRTVMTQIAGLLTAHGFNAHAEDVAAENPTQHASVISTNCPFGSAAQDHPVLCAVDRGLISGMLQGLGAASTSVTLQSKARGDDDCRVTA